MAIIHSRFWGIAASVAFAFVLTGAAWAKAAECPAGFPGKEIRFTVGYGAGGGTDAIARAVAAAMQQQQGWTTIVENIPGAGGGVMLAKLKVARPDGLTIGTTSTASVAVVDPAKGDVGYTWEDFDYIGTSMQTWNGLVALADKPFDDVKGLAEYAKKQGRATISVGSIEQEVLVDEINKQFGTNIVAVKATGAAEGMQLALGGHVDATIQGTLQVPQIKAGKMKQLASLIDRRVPYAPNSGTLKEQGINATPIDAHTMFLMPKKVDPAVKKCLLQAFGEAIRSDDYQKLMARYNNEMLDLGPDGVEQLVSRLAKFYAQALANRK